MQKKIYSLPKLFLNQKDILHSKINFYVWCFIPWWSFFREQRGYLQEFRRDINKALKKWMPQRTEFNPIRKFWKILTTNRIKFCCILCIVFEVSILPTRILPSRDTAPFQRWINVIVTTGFIYVETTLKRLHVSTLDWIIFRVWLR